jgi:hypothetical protein
MTILLERRAARNLSAPGNSGEDAAFPIIVDTHREGDILDGGDNKQSPQDQGQRAGRC